MFEESPEIEFNERNPKRLVETLAYVTCDGEVTDNSQAVLNLWNSVVDEYTVELKKKGTSPTLVSHRNAYGAEHITREIGGKVKAGIPSRAELFFTAVDSLIFSERYSDVKVIANLGGKNKDYSYSELESGNVMNFETVRENIFHAEINFRGQDGKFNGTSLLVENNVLTLRQNMNGEDLPVLQIIRDKERELTKMVAFIDTTTGSRKVAITGSKKVFWDLKRSIMWGNTYPYPQSVSAFVQNMDGAILDNDALVRHLDEV